jgi:hypothetical protein
MQWRGDPLLGWSQSVDAAAAPGSASRDCRKDCHWSLSSPTQSIDAAATPGSAVALKTGIFSANFQRKYNKQNMLKSRETVSFKEGHKQFIEATARCVSGCNNKALNKD